MFLQHQFNIFMPKWENTLVKGVFLYTRLGINWCCNLEDTFSAYPSGYAFLFYFLNKILFYGKITTYHTTIIYSINFYVREGRYYLGKRCSLFIPLRIFIGVVWQRNRGKHFFGTSFGVCFFYFRGDFMKKRIIDVTGTPLTPSKQGRRCKGNGKHKKYECCCDECEYYLYCFPQSDSKPNNIRNNK